VGSPAVQPRLEGEDSMSPDTKDLMTVPLRWEEVYFTNCPMVSANNIDQELGWCKTDFKKIGACCVNVEILMGRGCGGWCGVGDVVVR
jgi:hypothetical protein